MGIIIDCELPESNSFEIWPENIDAVKVFITCLTQWRTGSSGAIGLDYSVVFRIMEMYSIADVKDTFERVQVMETVALKLMNEKAS